MTNKIKETKLLLEGKSCKNCTCYSDSPWDGAICLWYNKLLPKRLICINWSSDISRKGMTRTDALWKNKEYIS